jgi:2-amino-4-hydroxy-6-hydroxymethyldihydropteridine diphosphokinase
VTESSVVRAALGLGSNLGDRRALLSAAVESLRHEPGVEVVAVSSLVESDPVGGPDQRDFLNAVVVVHTSLPPLELLALAHRCEQDAARVRDERWGPRTLDVDVLAYDAVVSDDPVLTLPHPRAVERGFVLVPWSEVDPTFELAGRTVGEWAAEADSTGVRPSELTWEVL